MAGDEVRAVTVGSVHGEPGRMPALGPTTIRIAGGRIAALDPASPSPEILDLVALPAPADAHDHGRGMRPLSFGALDDCLESWIGTLSKEPGVDPYLRAAVAFARLAEGGVAAANHCHNNQDPDRLVEEAEAVARAARDVGLRIAFAVPIADRNPLVYGDVRPLFDRLLPADRASVAARVRPPASTSELLAAVDAIAAFENPWFTVQYCPTGPQWVTDETLAAVADASARTGRRVHMHLLESGAQRAWADHAYPDGIVSFFDGIGLLSPRLTLAHGVWLRSNEVTMLAARGATVSVNSSSNLRLRCGINPTASFVDAGLAFGLGLDGMALDDDEDMLREMRLFWLLQRGFNGRMVLDAGRLFQAACIDGRRTVADDDGGSIVVGAPADFMVLDTTAMKSDVVDPDLDPLDLLLTRMTKADIAQLVVAGRSIAEGGRCVSVDLPALAGELVARSRAAWAAAPPDVGLTRRFGLAVADYYRCGCHAGPRLECRDA